MAESTDSVVVVQTEDAAAVVADGSSNCNSDTVATSGYKLHCSASDLLVVGHYFALYSEEPESEDKDKQMMFEHEMQSLDIGSVSLVRLSFELLLDCLKKLLHSCADQESGFEDKHWMSEPRDASEMQCTETGFGFADYARLSFVGQHPSADQTSPARFLLENMTFGKVSRVNEVSDLCNSGLGLFYSTCYDQLA